LLPKDNTIIWFIKKNILGETDDMGAYCYEDCSFEIREIRLLSSHWANSSFTERWKLGK
jgi:hypothetical protein